MNTVSTSGISGKFGRVLTFAATSTISSSPSVVKSHSTSKARSFRGDADLVDLSLSAIEIEGNSFGFSTCGCVGE